MTDLLWFIGAFAVGSIVAFGCIFGFIWLVASALGLLDDR